MSRFKFAERLGFSPPIEFEGDVKRSGHYTGAINFKKLFTFLKQGVAKNGITEPFDYKNFIETRVVKGGSTFTSIGVGVSSPDRVVAYTIPYETQTETGEDVSLRPKRTLNKCIDTINTVPDIAIVADFKSETIRLIIAFAYNKDGRKKIPLRNYAVVFTTFHYEHFETILREVGVDLEATGIITNGVSIDLSEKIKSTFADAFQKAGNDRNQLDWLYAAAPNFIIQERGKKQLITDLTLILEGLVDQIGVDEERVVMRILEGLFILYLLEGEPDDFLTKETDVLLNMLIRRKVKGITLFERMYEKMNDTGFGENNFTKLMQFLYKLWLRSSWAKQSRHANDDTTGPESIAYTNTRVLGFNNNEYNFEFERLEEDINNLLAVKATRKQRVGGSIKDGVGGFHVTSTSYHPFQPLRMSEIPEEGKKGFVIENTLIPAFYLKAFDDKGAWENFEKGVWLAVDILTIATGVGNILKFRRLLNLAVKGGKAISKLAIIKIGISAIEITSGTLSAMLNLTDGCAPAKAGEDKSLCQHMHEYLFILDLLSLSGDVVINRLLKKKARETVGVVEAAAGKAKNAKEVEELDQVIDHLNDIIGVNVKMNSFIRKFKRSKDSLRLIFTSEIITVLRGVTNQSSKVADGLQNNDIIKRVFESPIFQSYYVEVLGGKVDVTSVSAFAFQKTLYIRESSSVETFLKEIVHEGTHILDNKIKLRDNITKLVDETGEIIHEGEKMSKFIKSLNADQVFEFRARIFEREFELAAGLEPEYKTIKELIEFIKDRY
ncbi:hypothetical protein [Dokdonia sp.]|uniref:hypothetical protein n=1 Tax=Dokdonia sp. TaxID=2024995 RepID=UPI003263A241